MFSNISTRLTTTLKSLIPLHNHHHHNHNHNQIPQFSHSLLIPTNLHPPPLRSHPFNMSSQSSPLPPPDSSPPIKTVKVEIKGRVQGVFYRDWTVQNATELGLKGWVRNRRDGSVEALFSGSVDKVGEMQERCRRGPPSAVVTGVNVSPCDEDPGPGFQRRPTV
ncbi:putative acylphosphatase [Helianthus annuus]|nr:putative acylphosphatase [Helianthus annuus]